MEEYGAKNKKSDRILIHRLVHDQRQAVWQQRITEVRRMAREAIVESGRELGLTTEEIKSLEVAMMKNFDHIQIVRKCAYADSLAGTRISEVFILSISGG